MPLLHYRTLGRGPFLFILHGMYGMSDNWMGIARAVSKHFTVVIPDMRNHGRSFHSEVHTYEAMAGDIENLAAHLGVKRFFLAGHSMGGKVAMQYSDLHPGHLNGLVIFDIAPVDYPDGNHHVNIHRHILESMHSVSVSQLKSREEAMEVLGPLLPDVKLLQFLLKNLSRNHDGTFRWMLNIPVLLSHLDILLKGFTVLPGPVTGFPVVFAKGAKSDYVIPSYYPAMNALYPAHELVEIPDAGHWLHQEQPDRVTDVLLNLAAQ